MIYPYKTAKGYCSILTAIDLEDAKHHFLCNSFDGVTFCELEGNCDGYSELYLDQAAMREFVYGAFADNEVYKTTAQYQ